ncbi:MAG: Flp family type IVb pilin [Clostridia bacterium]|nr:Flp family type IVb pilin [Clostridia bacterium]
MYRRWTQLWKWATGEDAATTAEYALILALVVIVLIGALTTLGSALHDKITDIAAQLQGS